VTYAMHYKYTNIIYLKFKSIHSDTTYYINHAIYFTGIIKYL